MDNKRVTVELSEKDYNKLQEFIKENGYVTQTDALRTIIREKIEENKHG